MKTGACMKVMVLATVAICALFDHALASSIELPAVRYGSGPGRCLDIAVTNAGSAPATMVARLSSENVEFCRASVSSCYPNHLLRPGDTCRIGVRLSHDVDDAIRASLLVDFNTVGQSPRQSVFDLSGHPSKARADAIAVTRKLLREALGSDPARRSLALRALDRNEASGHGAGAGMFRKSF